MTTLPKRYFYKPDPRRLFVRRLQGKALQAPETGGEPSKLKVGGGTVVTDQKESEGE